MNNGQSGREIRAYFTAGYWPLNCPAKHNGTTDPSPLISPYLCVYVCVYRDVAIFNYIKLRTKVVCTYVVSHHIICQPGSSFCACPAREKGEEWMRRGEGWERDRHLVVTKFYKNCWKRGKSFPVLEWSKFIWYGFILFYFIFLFFLFFIYDNLFPGTGHTRTHNAINCDK